MSDRSEVTKVLVEAAKGEAGAVDRLFPIVYQGLRRLAQMYLNNQAGSSTLQATALVHEAYIKLVDYDRVAGHDRAHFFAVAARAIRQVLIDHERNKGRIKRWGGQSKLPLEAVLTLGEAPSTSIWALSRALEKLGAEHPEKERVIELRFFGGLTHGEIAEILGVTVRTVERYWRFGRAWLYRELVASREVDSGEDAAHAADVERRGHDGQSQD